MDNRRKFVHKSSAIILAGLGGCASTGETRPADECTNTLLANEIPSEDIPEKEEVIDHRQLSERHQNQFFGAVGGGTELQEYSEYWSTTRYIEKDGEIYEVIQSEC